LNIHLTYVPYIKSAGELKTKPTQHSAKMLMEMGIRPDILLCRTELPLNKEITSKIALFCNVEEDSVIEVMDAETIYEVPTSLAKKNLDQIVLRKFGMSVGKLDLDTWNKFVARIKNPKFSVTIGLVGKYNQVKDSYKSILEAFIHAGAINNTKVDVVWIDSETIQKNNAAQSLKGLDGILVAPGFGNRGIEGKIESIRFAREQSIPFFGICLGMQCAVIEFARNVAGMKDANSGEFKKGKNLVINLMSSQKNITDKGGTMRLGSYPCNIRKGTLAYAAYGAESIEERHRHRYEFNNAYRTILEQHGMKLSGVSPDTTLIEIIELKNHPWFVGVQFHPEYKSRAVKGHPLFIDFVKAALTHKKN
jgi:CTP synthase